MNSPASGPAAPRWPFFLIILFVLAGQATMILTGVTPVAAGRLVDTDGYMWLMRVEDLLNGGGWYNHAVPRMNTPFGDVLNWSRPTDLTVLLLSLPFRLFFPWHEAIFWGGALMGPVMQIGIGLALIWAFKPFTPPLLRPLLMLVALLQPPLAAYMLPGRPDHHGLIIILEIFYMGLCCRALLNNSDWRTGLLAGFLIGVALWVSVEAQFTLIMIAGLFGLLWVWWGGQSRLDFLVAHGMGLLGGVFLGLLIERGPGLFEDPALDKISWVHLLLAGANLLVVLPLREKAGASIAERLFAVVLTGALGLLAVALVFPQALRGPTAQIDPLVMKEFFLQISEMQPLWPKDADAATTFFLMLGTAPWGLMVWGFSLWRRPLKEPLTPYFPLLLVTVAMTIAALLHARFSMFAAPLGACFLILGIERLNSTFEKIEKSSDISITRVLSTTTLVIFPLIMMVIAAQFASEPEDKVAQNGTENEVKEVCDLSRLTPFLADPQGEGRTPGRIMTSLNFGPQLLYFTPHAVVAGPYHRNRDGILDSVQFFRTEKENVARAMAARRGITLVLDCDEDADKPEKDKQERSPASLSAKLLNGNAPAWLVPVTLPFDTDFKLYRVQLDGTEKR